MVRTACGFIAIVCTLSQRSSGQELDLGPPMFINWRVSPVSFDCTGPVDGDEREWFQPDFDDASWSAIALPHLPGRTGAYDLYYRGRFVLSSLPASLPLSFSSDDGLWVFVNGTYLGHWGGGCHGAGCVNRIDCGAEGAPPLDIAHLVVPGENVIGVHVSNWGERGYIAFSASLLRWKGRVFSRDCAGPPDWTTLEFDDSRWGWFSSPTAFSEPTTADFFFRTRFHLESVPPRVVAGFGSDDGIWIYVNEVLLGHWGGSCGGGGCVNACASYQWVEPMYISDFLVPGDNVIAVHVSNGGGPAFFDFALAGSLPTFVRGDCNDDGILNISDPVRLARYLFLGEAEAPLDCLDAADQDDNGRLELADVVGLLSYLFATGSPPAPPLLACGPDPTPDSLGCEGFSRCDGGDR